ncbi:unnamed protein product [Rotaria sp. Silwood2]|nr:unnamed protein product [Rotaria sp. Silwood2]CAF4176874.1 unnamed protein product [Rotaria sp. Silwood2]CAF4479523.1 unnamed protein product [Rotaria sp. Silwood2]
MLIAQKSTACFSANKIPNRAKFDLFVLIVVVPSRDTDELLIPIDSLLTLLSDKLFRLQIIFKDESVNGCIECSESDHEHDCFREERSSIEVESFVTTKESIDLKYDL